MQISEWPAFAKDVKRLQKRYRSLPGDLEILKKVLRVKPEAQPPFSFRLDALGTDAYIIKVKKIACKSLKGRGANSGLRLIYALAKASEEIVLIELYHKSDQVGEDRERIKAFLSA